MKESIERNKALNKFEETLILNKIKKDSTHHYLTSESGFWYYYNIKNNETNIQPQIGDEVIFSYEIRDLRDSIIYSKEEIGEKRYLVDKEELITGLQDGIKLMKQGETVTFLFPSYKAFGFTGNDRVNTKEPLIYTVHLKTILNKE